jgi:hypothetical protein
MMINYIPRMHGSPDIGPVPVDSDTGRFGLTQIKNDFVLFEFENASGDEVDVLLTCSYGGLNMQNDPGTLSWSEGETGKKCIEFSDFGPYQPDVAVGQCDYVVSVLRLAQDKGSSVVLMTIYNG